MIDARNEINYLQVEWSTCGVNLWTVDLVTQVLTAGTATYSAGNCRADPGPNRSSGIHCHYRDG